VHDALRALATPFGHLTDPGQRLFWPFLLGALVLALLLGGSWRALCARRVWLHRSSLLDYQLLFAKPVIEALLFPPLLFSAYALARWTLIELDSAFGVPEPSTWSPWAIRALYTATLFLAWDASRYLVHRVAHEVPFLWELHQVHHSAEVMTPFTLYRSHPLESLLFKLRGLFVTGLVTGLFLHLFRADTTQYDFLGVNALGFVLNLAGGNLRHSHVFLRYPRWLERVLISPAQHQLHHERRTGGHRVNYGSWLAIWDLLGGSWVPSTRRPRAFGLMPAEQNHRQSLASALARPVLGAVRRLGRPARR